MAKKKSESTIEDVLSIIKDNPTKKQLVSKVEGFVDSIKNDGISWKDLLAKATRNKDFWDTFEKSIRPYVYDEMPQGETETQVQGVKISKSSSTTYDYTNDPTWVTLNDKITELKEDQKKVEEILKARGKMQNPKITTEVDEDGVPTTVGFAIKYSKDTIKVAY